MVGGSSALNLSLLSRGVGEISKNGHEKIDVVFEPQDYYNFVTDSRRIYLPPIQHSYTYDEPEFSISRTSKKSVQEINMPKTFTTRKGALLLFSEDMAHRKRHSHHHHIHKSHMDFDDRESQLSKSADEIDLRTVDDLAKSILSFGAQGPEREDGMYLKFVHGRRKRDYFDRQIRPGFSAKRYLSSWTKCWDDNVLEKVISKGYLTEKSLFYYNPLMPHLQRRLNDDMSHYPTPYKLMRSMLMSPGSLSGYTFYRIRPESAETIMTQDVDLHGVPPSQGASIKVISTKDGVQREVTYGSLDKKAQEEVLTDLLVKSAVHYAMKKQQEYFEDNLMRAMESNKIREVSEGHETPASMPQFDMKEAVESLLDTQKSKGAVIEADLPEDRSSVRSGSIKPKHSIKKHGKGGVRSSSSSPALEDKEYIGGVPVVSFRDGSGSPSSVPQLPHIPGAIPLTTIGEVSREQTTVVPLPPIGGKGIPVLNVHPPTPQHTTLESYDGAGKNKENLKTVSEVDTEDEWGAQVPQSQQAENASTKGDVETESKKEKVEVSSQVLGSTESVVTSVHSQKDGKLGRAPWKGSQTSVKSSKKGAGSVDDGSVKGSVIMGPEGELINVGGTIKPHLRDIDLVHDANKVFGKDLVSDESDTEDQPDEWKKNRTLPPGARDQMRNYANKRVTPTNLSVLDPLRLPRHGDPKIDYTSGDIDATLSISSWSYAPRDQDPEIDVLKKTSSLQSLPNIEVEFLKDLSILSRATEKTEPADRQISEDVDTTDDSNKAADPSSNAPNADTISSLQTPFTQSVTPGGRITSILDTPMGPLEDTLLEESEKDGPEQISEKDEEENGTASHLSQKSPGRKGSVLSKISVVDPEMSKSASGSGGQAMSRSGSMADLYNRTLVHSRNRRRYSLDLGGKVKISSDNKVRAQSEDLNKNVEVSLDDLRKKEGKSIEASPSEEKRISVGSRRASRESIFRSLSKQSINQDEVLFEGPAESEILEVASDRKSTVSGDESSVLAVEGQEVPGPSLEHPSSKTESPKPSEDVARSDSAKSKVSEKEIVDALADHAQQIAQNVLSRSASGKDLEEDVRRAAKLWMETHPPRDISRSQSVQDKSIVQEIVSGQEKRKSAGPTAGEYRELIKANLKTAMSSSSGENVPADTEVSPELIEALAKEEVAAEDLEIVQDDDGKSLIRSKSQVSMAMGGVKEGHIYVPVAKNGQKGPATSIPVDRQSNADIGQLAVIHYVGDKDLVKEGSEKTPSDRGSKTKSQPPSTLGESIAEEETMVDDASEHKSHVSFKDEAEIEDEFQKAVEGLEQKSEKQSLKSGVTDSDGKKSKVSQEKAASPVKKKEEFIVGKVDTKDDIKALYGQPDPPPKEPSPPTMVKKPSPVAEPVPSPPKSAGKKSKDGEPKKLEVADDKSSKSASTAKTSTSGTGSKTVTSAKSEEMAQIQQDFQNEIKNLFGKVPTKQDVKGKGKTKKIPSPTKKPAKEGKAKGKAKGKGKKKEESPEPKPAEPEPVPQEPVKELTPPPPTPPPQEEPPASDLESDRRKSIASSINVNLKKVMSKESVSTMKSEESFEFHIVRDTPSPSPPPPKAPSIPSVEEEPETEEEEPPEDEDKTVKKQIVKKTKGGPKDEAARLRMISNREARAAKRAAQAEKRRQEVEKRRREREDQLKREKEEFERQQQLKAELEEERKRQEEQRRIRRAQQDAERDDEERREEERLRRQKLEEEKERRRKEEYQRKLEEMKRRQAEEEKRRHEEMLKKQAEEEEARREEAEKMAAMEEEERRQYELQKKLEEEERLKREEEERIRREEEAKKAMEEARRLAEEMARKQAEMEARLKFNRTLQVEARGLEHSQDITRAFVFSYFELLQWLGLDIPEFEVLKLNQY
ncbi:titin homolog isoform X1 [Crassostrea angulata]|uniref:titin homolog isoform X1 n=1 Tax=Magallana angulata TaxID=2784310 RepID=UPI0022B129EF|nr:titin homolog isoform X1 [Crassostrea angulata]